jgi:hypothetical protein
MTPAESRVRNVNSRVSWQGAIADQGTVIGVDWSGVHIRWDSGKSSFHHHNNMNEIEPV